MRIFCVAWLSYHSTCLSDAYRGKCGGVGGSLSSLAVCSADTERTNHHARLHRGCLAFSQHGLNGEYIEMSESSRICGFILLGKQAPRFNLDNFKVPSDRCRGVLFSQKFGFPKLSHSPSLKLRPRAFCKTQANSSSDIASLHDDWILVSTLHDSLDLAAKFRPDSTKNPFKPSKRV